MTSAVCVCCRKEREEEERIKQASKSLLKERKMEMKKQRYADWSGDDDEPRAKAHVRC